MPVSEAALVAYKRRIALYRDRTAAQLVAAWDRLPAYNEEDLDQFTRSTTHALAAAKTAAVSLAAAFFALAIGTRPAGVNPADVEVEPDLRGPFRATWHALSVGRPYEEAVTVGRSTSQAIGFDFVQHTARRTGDVVAERSGREVRWRRAPGPNSCPWCRDLATGNTWPTSEAADFGHERCDCDAVPV
jgi:hypothetical protein